MSISAVSQGSVAHVAHAALQAQRADVDSGVQNGKPDHDGDADDKVTAPVAQNTTTQGFGGVGHSLNVFA